MFCGSRTQTKTTNCSGQHDFNLVCQTYAYMYIYVYICVSLGALESYKLMPADKQNDCTNMEMYHVLFLSTHGGHAFYLMKTRQETLKDGGVRGRY